MKNKLTKMLAKLPLSNESKDLGESMVNSGNKIKSTKVPSLTGSHNVYEVEFPRLTPRQWRDNYEAGIKAIKANEAIK